MKSFVIEKFANNEVRVGWQDLPHTKKKRGDTESVKKTEYYAKQVALIETETVKTASCGFLLDRVNGNSVMTHEEVDCHEKLRSHALDIINDFQRTKRAQNDLPRRGYGHDPKATTFGAYARHTILEAGAIASKGVGQDGRGVEVTLTIPGNGSRVFRAVSQWSGYIVNRLLQTIRRREEPVEWFYVWELQRRGALHLHMALSGSDQRTLLRIGRKIRKCWYRVLEEITRRTGINCFVRRDGRGSNTKRSFFKGNRVAEIRKSLAAYFAKYVSKGKSKELDGQMGYYYPPARWWGISRSLLRKVKNERIKVRFTGMSEEQLAQLLSTSIGYLRRYNPVRATGYDFELSYGDGANYRHLGYGERFIHWFGCDSFDAIQVWLPQFLRYLWHLAGRPIVEGDITWMVKADKPSI